MLLSTYLESFNPDKAGLFEGSFFWREGGGVKKPLFRSLEDAFFEKPQWGGGGISSRLRVNVKL